jgi:sulfate/thiosulfate transport system permease protein
VSKAPAFALAPGPTQRAVAKGVTLYVVLLVAVPLAAMTHAGLADGFAALWDAVSTPIARSALWLTLWTATVIAVLNALLGTATAWVLVRYRFPGRTALSAAVDLPFAIPTLVAGMMLAVLYGKGSLVGDSLAALGIELIFAPLGIVLALLFVTLPFVIRAVEPVLLEIDPAEEEAALVLGAGPWRAFRTVYLPAIAPAALSGAIRSLGRAVGEFGSIVVVAGNIPLRTLTAPVYVFGEIESGSPHSAAAVSVVLLALALVLHGVAHVIDTRSGARNA